METMTVEEFHAALRAQGVSQEDVAFKCPLCDKVQSGRDFMKATGRSFDEIEKYLGFSCIGRFTGGMSAIFTKKSKKKQRMGCDYAGGGLFRLHTLEIITEDGEHHPRFILASPEEAKASAEKNKDNS